MLVAFVQHLELLRRQSLVQALLQCGSRDVHSGQPLASDSSPLRWGAM
jgi:hypothetical protein